MRLNCGYKPSRMMDSISGSVATLEDIGASSMSGFSDW
jgi:hypothetical protein